VEKYRQGKVPRPGVMEEKDRDLQASALKVTQEAEKMVGELAFHRLLISIW